MSDHIANTRPIVPMKWEGPISDTDTARKYLIRYMAANFEDRTFMTYIRDELAGDFAYNLARALAQPAPVSAVNVPELSDDEIVKVLHSLAIDTYPSKYGFPETQVSATNVPMIRKIVAAYLSAAPSAPAVQEDDALVRMVRATPAEVFSSHPAPAQGEKK